MAKEHPRYADTEWPAWEFREYPMAVYPGSSDGGRTPDPNPDWNPGQKHSKRWLQECVIVQNEEERLQVLGGDAKTVTDSSGAQRVATEADERAALIAEADRLGVVIDKRWSLARIQDAIDSHKAEVV